MRSSTVVGTYRLAMSGRLRVARVVMFVVLGVFLAGLAFGEDVTLAWRAAGLFGVATTVAALRIVTGPAVVVAVDHLRLQPNWPIRRNIPWYRILAVDVDPMRWVLVLELNNGDRVELPAVEHLPELSEQIALYRSRLDSLDA